MGDPLSAHDDGTPRWTTILFDLDHTLLDSDTSEALAFDDTLRSIGIDNPSEHLAAYQQLNQALWKQVEQGELSPNDVKRLRFEQLLGHLGMDGDAEAMGARFLLGLGSFGELYPGARELLDEAGFARVGLVTNGIGSVQRQRIDRLDLGRHFQGVAISGEVGVAKPDPAIFDHLGFGKLDPARTIMIGDSLTSDIAAGVNAGFATCWYNPAGKPGPAKTESTPTMTVGALSEIPAILEM